MGKIVHTKKKLSPQAKHFRNIRCAVAVQLPPIIANFKN